VDLPRHSCTLTEEEEEFASSWAELDTQVGTPGESLGSQREQMACQGAGGSIKVQSIAPQQMAGREGRKRGILCRACLAPCLTPPRKAGYPRVPCAGLQGTPAHPVLRSTRHARQPLARAAAPGVARVAGRRTPPVREPVTPALTNSSRP